MSKFLKCLSVITVMMICLVTLASCSDSYSFYETWYEAGAEIDEDNVFEALTIEEVLDKVEADESFIVFVGSSTSETSIKNVESIQYAADNSNYDGKVYILDTTEKTSVSERRKVEDSLKISLSATASLIAICYDEGVQTFETSRPNAECDRFIFDGSNVDIVAVAEYAFDNYPVSK